MNFFACYFQVIGGIGGIGILLSSLIENWQAATFFIGVAIYGKLMEK
jgi:hypothetical protein